MDKDKPGHCAPSQHRDVRIPATLFTVLAAVNFGVRDWGMAEGGPIAPGKFADVVLFDPDTLSRGEEIWVDDMPGGNGC